MANNQIKFDVGFNFNKSDLNTLTTALKNIQNEVNKANLTGNLTDGLKQAGVAASQLESILNQAWNSKLGQLDLSKVNNNIKATYGSVANLKTMLEGSGAAGAAAYNRFASSVLNTNVQLKQSNKLINDMATTLGNTFRYGISSSIINRLAGSIETAFNYSKKLDTSLNDIRIVTGLSADNMERFAKQANDAAKSMGASTLDYTNAALIYYQQGLSDEEVAARAETTIKAANVTGQKGEEVSEQLTAVWNGYKVTAEETEAYVDKLAAVAATTAADLEELSVGMSKVASAANAMGVDFDDLNAQIATIVSVTRQAPESVGTALKTIYARLGDLKVDGVDEFGVSLGEVSGQLQTMGIQILDQQGNLRDMTSVISEVAVKWDSWTEAQKQAAAVAMAGKRQYNNLIALFDNWDMYTKALNTSMDAMGTLQEQQDTYMESTAAHLKQLRAEAENTYDILFNQDTVNGFADALTNALGIFNNFISAIGGGGKAFTALGTIATNIFSQQIGNQLGNLINNQRIADINKNRAAIQQDIMNLNASKGDFITGKALEEQVELVSQVKQIQSGLTEEQHKYLMELQQSIAVRTEEINRLQQATKILKQQGLNENISLNSLKTYITEKQKELKLQQDLLTYLELGTQANNTLTEQQKQKLSAVEYINDAERAEAEILNKISTSQHFILKALQDENLTEEKRVILINAQNKEIEKQKELINQLRIGEEGLAAKESGALAQKIASKEADKGLFNTVIEQGQTRQNMQIYVQALSASLMMLQSISGVMSVLNNKELETEEKTKQITSLLMFSLPMILMNMGQMKKALATLTSSMGLFATTTDASNAGVLKMGVSLATAAPPITAIVLAITALVGILVAVDKAHKKAQASAKEAAEEATKAASAINEEAQAHKDLVTEYDDAYDQYKHGNLSKEELWKTTDKLIEAYGLESSRLAVLTGDYETFTKAIKKAREEEEKEAIARNREAVEKSAESVGKNAEGSPIWGNGISTSKGRTRVNILNAQSEVAFDKKLKARAEELFGEAYDTQTGNVSFEAGNAAELAQTVETLRKWREILVEESEAGEASDRVKQLDKKIEAFTKDGNLDALLKNQGQLLDSLLAASHLDEASTQAEFNANLENLKKSIQQEINLGNLIDSEDTDSAVRAYIGQISSGFANQFIIDESIKEKFGDDVDKTLLEAFHQYDPNTQTAILKLGFDFDKETGKKDLEAYAKFITGNQRGIYSIPVSFQDQINDTVLKGKDINKADWENMAAGLPKEALDMLGDRTEFNNRSIGERISLLQQVNQLVRENNLLAIQEYEVNKDASEEILENLKKQEELLLERARRQQDLVNRASSEQEKENRVAQLEEIQNQLEEITKQKYEIQISLNMEEATDNLVQSIVGDVMTEADQIKAATESIGEGWKVAAEDVATFAAAFPELMEGMERLEDGSLQLSKDIVNAELEGAQERINANKQVAIEAAEDKIKQLKLQLELLEEEKRILQEALNGEKTKAETEKALREAVSNYENQLLQNGLISQADALNKAQIAEQEGVNGMIDILGGVNDAINIIHNNFANMLTTGPLQEYAATAGSIKNVAAQSVKNVDASFDTADVDAMIARVGELDQEISQTKTQIASYEGFVSEMMNSVAEADKAANRVKSGLAGKEPKSKSGGSKKDKDKDLKKLDEEFDRYWEIHKALDQLDRDLKKLDKDQENLHGKELIRSLKQENELLSQQADLYKQLATEQQKEAAELRDKLAGSGVTFDASGAIINYAQATAEALQKYNEAVKSYNAGLLDDAAFKIHEKAFEEFKKNLERYDNLFYKEMQETQEKLDEIRRKQLTNNLKAWEVEIQLKLDWKQLERDWNDFLTEISEDFKSVFKDLRVDLKSMLTNAGTYTGAEGTIGSIVGAVKDVTGEIDKMMGGGSSSMFESVSQAQEKLKELNSELLDSSKALHDLWKQAWENYLDGIDQVNDAFDKLLDRFERINDELEFQNKLIELLYGDEAYGLMSKLYEGQERNAEVQLQSLKGQVDMWKELFDASGATMENQMEWSEDQQKYYDNWIKAQSSLNDLVIEYIELLKKDYMNTISDILKQFETFVTSGSSLNYIGTQWERISDNADKYYDSVEGAYQIQTLANKIDESIANSNTLKVQQKLMALREKEITYLREKENLTEYDIKAAELRYQIALKEIALEEAQQNKTSMKLTRNEQGNWSYQYVADETEVANKRQELLDTYNDLYQLASDAYESNLNALQELQQKYIDSAKEIYENENISEEERQQQLLELREWYLEQYKLLTEENQLYRNDLATSGAALLLEIYEQDQEAYQAMTENERELVDTLINANIDDYMQLEDRLKGNYQNIGDKAREVMSDTRADWTSGAQTIADLWNKDGGWSVKAQVVSAYDSIQLANQRYKEAVDWCAAAVERNFGPEGIVGAIQDAEYETDSLRDKTVEMVNTAIPYLQELKSYVNQIEDAWRNVQQSIIDAINLIEEYLRKVGEARAAQEAQIAAAQAREAQIASAKTGGSSGSGSGSRSSASSKNAPTLLSTQVVSPTADGKWYEKLIYSDGSSETRRTNHMYTDNIGDKKGSFATGGYTGSWGGSAGRLAVLHQKEIVLNKDDTANFLSAIHTIRDLNSGLNHSIQDAILNAVARTAVNIGGLNTNALRGIANNSSSTENIYNINAEFPNAENVNEIREAILSLPNLASQYIHSNLK